MKYKVFVASTYKDLETVRKGVIKKLRKAGLDVVCMEDFAPDGQHPAKSSVKQVRECDFCIVLVGFQIGTRSTVHSGNRSITQLEVETAESSNVQVLPFILRDTPENRQNWPKEFIHLDDAEVVEWRALLSTHKMAEFFNEGESPEVLPSIVRLITQKEGICVLPPKVATQYRSN